MSEGVTKLWELYDNGVSYQASIGLRKNIPEYVRFFEGKQWAKPTQRTKNLPRPVINIIKMICRSKKAAILSSPLRNVYHSDIGVDVTKLNRFSDYIVKELGQDKHDRNAIDDAVKKGTYIYHYYWDAEARGMDGSYAGGVRCELIDVLSVFFSNPTEPDVQKQKWVLIATREEVSAVRDKCTLEEERGKVGPDEQENNAYGTVEQDGDNLCTVLTRYFRRDGEVYYERATKNAAVTPPTPLAPDIKAAMRELGYDEEAEGDAMPDEADKGESKALGAYLYPIVVGVYDKREKSIYGLSEVEGLIPNQKAINFFFAMCLLNAQENAWGKYVVSPGALKGQSITNEPGQVLIDHTKTMQGIKKLTEQTLHSMPLDLVNTLTQLTRSVTGATEVMTGEVLGKNMSGAAIAQLQSQAATPIEDLRDNFKEAKKQQGLVLAQFYKLYYSGKKFSYEEERARIDAAGNPMTDELGEPVMEKAKGFDTFNGEEFKNAELDVVAETTTGTKSSAAGDINILDTLLAQGKISLKTYFNAYPEDAISNKSEILKGIEADEQAELTRLRAQIEGFAAQMQAQAQELDTAKGLLQKQKETVDKAVSVIQENSRLKTQLVALYTEAQGKINQANAQIAAGNQRIAEDEAKISELTSDATLFAEEIARRDGMSQNSLRTAPNGTPMPIN